MLKSMEIFARQNGSFSVMDGHILKNEDVFKSPRRPLSNDIERFSVVRFLFHHPAG
jgi:hypothetical protein